MTYENGGQFDRALKKAIRNSGGDPGDGYRQALRDRFLCRVFSDPDERFILKGGSGLLARIPDGRATRDIDFVTASRESPEAALTALVALAGKDMGDFLTFKLDKWEESLDENGYSRLLKLRFQTFLGHEEKDPILVDLSLDCSITQPAERISPANRVCVEGLESCGIVISVSGILQKFFFKVDLAVIAGAIIVLSIIDWRYTVLVGSFLGIICVCCYFSRLKIKNEQVALIGASSEVSTCVQEMTQSSTDLKVFSNISTVEDYCSSVYKRYASAQSRLGKNETKLMSKYEMYSFIFMVLGLAVMLFSYIDAIPVSASNTTIAFYMSIFMLMLFRPTLQKWIEYQKSTNAIEYIEFIKQPRRKQNSVRKINAKSVESIQLKDISVSFGNLKIFENINITIQPGVTVGIKGVNGAGKTTLAKLLLGLLTPTSGTFCINSTEKFSTLQNSNITDYVGLFSADMYIYSSSVSNNIAFNIFNDKAASKSISHLNQLPEDFLLFFNGINISQGERQKVLLDRCLQHEKDIYVFDEPDTNLDFNSQREIIKIFDELKKRGKAVVIISHNEHTLDCCDKFYSLENGKIIEQE